MSKEQSSDLSFALLRDIDVKEAPQDLLDLLIVAEELVLSDLVDYIQDYIIHNEIEWLKLNLVRVLQTTLKHKSWHKLRAYCEETICEDASKVLSRVVNSEQAIRDCGPQFDLVGFGEDLNIFTRTCYMRDYERGIIDAINFNLLDYEVFQIIEK
ncbi:8924_t:CDS:2 [Entrophospora sp. SA101]|nr:8924_t:CDS:2 [Entrophospora sp. SA101]